MKKHKVLIIGPTSPPYTGMSVATETVLNSSLKDKFDIIHLDTVDKRDISNMGRFDVINILLAFQHFFKLTIISIKEKPQIVYLPIAQNVAGYLRDSLFLVVCRVLNIKTVIHLHGGYFRDFYKKSNFIIRKLIEYTLRRVSRVIVLGECLKYIFKGLVPEEKICVVPNGINDEFSSGPKNFSESKNLQVLFLSNLLREKGIFELINTIPSISRRYKNIKFIFAGEWYSERDKAKALRFIKKNKISSCIEFAGVVKGMKKKEYLSKSDIFVLPTFYPFEGQPLTILEAMSASLPIISADKGAIRETIVDGGNGFLLQQVDSEQLIGRISELIENPALRQKMGICSRQLFLQRYTKDIFISNLEKLLFCVGEEAELKTRVLFIAPLPPPYAGPEINSEILLNSSLKEELDLIHLRSNINLRNATKGKITLSSTTRFSVLCFKIIGTIICRRPRVIYMLLSQNFTGFIRDSIVVLMCKFFRKKVILHFRGSNFENFYRNCSQFLRGYIDFILQKSDIIILQARWLKKFFSKFVSEEKIKVICNPVCLKTPMPIKTVYGHSAGREVRVFYMSYLSVAKGFLVLINAAREILKKTQNIKFVIAGDTINTERNIFYAQNGRRINFQDVDEVINKIKQDKFISNHIVFLNELKSLEKKYQEFFESDIFVLPSYSEGCPMVVLEAMAAGLPLVVTPVGSLPEIIKNRENCLFAKIGDHVDLKEKILLLANNPSLCKRMGEYNRHLIETKYSVNNIVSQFQDIFTQSS